MLLSEKSIYPSKRLDKPIEVTLDLVIESIDTFDDLNKLLDISVPGGLRKSVHLKKLMPFLLNKH